MDYTARYNELKGVFNPDLREIQLPGSDIRIINTHFSSDSGNDSYLNENDMSVPENSSFSYPIFQPSDPSSRKAILLLHGLNERSWVKYLVWAEFLARNTGSYVILFPISFHINRSPESWRDPKAMYDHLNVRKTNHHEITMASFANIALSDRLTEDPMRFFNSGYQTVEDIVKLLSLIKDGKHNVIPGGSRVNIFAYSIGAFLSQIIMLGNPGNLFDDTKLFMLCGGSVFSNMYGTSKFIMDSMAYERLFNFYMKDFEDEVKRKSPFLDSILSGKLGMAFRSMIDINRLKKFREKSFNALKNQIRSIALVKDKVIPAAGIVKTLDYDSTDTDLLVKVDDFPFPYTHENPFPLFNSPLSKKVDECFESLFAEASFYLL